MTTHRPTPSPAFVPTQIVSGGQTGVDRAALDVAIAIGIGHGGWCPAGRLAEDGSVPSRYDLIETDSADYPIRTEANVVDSDATLILYEGQIKGGTRLTQKICRRLQTPHLAIRIGEEHLDKTRRWLYETKPEILNVAGPRESTSPGIYHRSMNFLLKVLVGE